MQTTTGEAVVENDWKVGIEVWIGKIVAVFGGIWAIWTGVKFAVKRARQIWKTLTAFADSVQALQAISNELQAIKAERAAQTELSTTPFWKADSNGNCVDANTAFCQLVNMNLTELRGAGWYSCLHPDDQDDVMAEWKAAVKDRADFQRVFRLRSQTETIRVRARAKMVETNGQVEFHGVTVVLTRKPVTAE